MLFSTALRRGRIEEQEGNDGKEVHLPRHLHGAGAVAALKSKEEAMAKKSICPITRSQFRDRAKPVTITINDVPMVVPTKEFSTGSFGWYLNGKTVLEIDGKSVQVQLGLNLTVIGSKELADEPEASAPPPALAAPISGVA